MGFTGLSIFSKAQSAIEYLMTYGWMLLVVAIVGGSVFSMVGSQSIDSVSGFNSQDVNVQDFGVSTENGLMFSMSDPIGQTEVKEIAVSGHELYNVTYVVNQDVSDENIVNLPGVVLGEEGNELEIDITYDSGNLENLTTSGTLTGSLKVDESFNNRTMIMAGLAGYWPLNEEVDGDGGIVIDHSGNENHGETQGGVKTDADGVFGTNAYQFDGEDDVVDVEDNLGFTDADPITVTAWVKVSDPDRRQGVTTTKDHAGGQLLGIEDNQVYAFMGGDEWSKFTGGTIDSDVLYHIAFTYDGSELSQFIDASKVNTATSDDWTISSGWQIGRARGGGGDRNFDGVIDEPKIYDRALSEGEIETIYEQGDIE